MANKTIEFNNWLIEHLKEALEEIEDLYMHQGANSEWANSINEQLKQKIVEFE